MKDAVIFSSFVPKEDMMYAAKFYLDSLVDAFSDCDFYVGVNRPYCKEWIEYLEAAKHKVSLIYEVVDEELNIDSDASAYQVALKLLRMSETKYKTLLFMHTKRITHYPTIADLEGIRKHNFTKEIRQEAEEIFKNLIVGLFAQYCSKTIENKPINSLDRFYNFYHTSTELFPTDAMYYIRGDIVYDFIHNCNKDFFNKNLLKMGFDRYFFERDFPSLCWRTGYLFKVNNVQTNTNNAYVISLKDEGKGPPKTLEELKERQFEVVGHLRNNFSAADYNNIVDAWTKENNFV